MQESNSAQTSTLATSTLATSTLATSIAETHISTVFFIGDRAYKILKPIKTSFLDFSTPALRLAAASQEIELNRRMAPDVYLGSADVIENGELMDRMIVMRRLPDDRRLTTLLEERGGLAGEATSGAVEHRIREVARTIAVFHAGQPPIFDAGQIAGRDGLAKNWNDNFDDMEPLVGTLLRGADVARSRTLVDEFLDSRSALFEQRMADGLVRDGHGDLTAADIFCLDDGPRILDCLAFDANLRISDVLLDVAFLVMDLDRLVGADLSRAFLRWYCEFAYEHHPAALAHHYVAYRAHVRAKVEGIRFRQGEPSAAAAVRAYHDLCLAHLERAQLTVTLIGGTPGTGKSTLARGLAASSGAMVLSTDELRKDLVGRAHADHEVVEPDAGIYAPNVSEQTYDALLDQARTLLGRAESVILDASWNRVEHRVAARIVAAACGARVTEIECALPSEVAKERIAKRLEEGTDASDARPEIVDVLRSRHEPWPEALVVDTRASIDVVVDRTLAALGE